jgi:hypothetical protein
MHAKDFSLLSYQDQLKVIGDMGRLQHSVIVNDYQFSLFKVKKFYVELKRSIKELCFEEITAMGYEDLPPQYKQTEFHKNPW